MLFANNFSHGDMHPGNILITGAESVDTLGVTLLDAGIVTNLSDSDQQNFIDLFRAIAAVSPSVDCWLAATVEPVCVHTSNIGLYDRGRQCVYVCGGASPRSCFLGSLTPVGAAVLTDHLPLHTAQRAPRWRAHAGALAKQQVRRTRGVCRRH